MEDQRNIGKVDGKLYLWGKHYIYFMCPGCNEPHIISINTEHSWGWNNSTTAPTFTPSVLVTSGHFSPNYKPGEPCWCTFENGKSGFKCSRCHSFVNNGKIQFLNDCSHSLAGQTVELPDFEEHFMEN